jgi:signal transduction histidine kinase/ligand-binding sensor domain-containing protein
LKFIIVFAIFLFSLDCYAQDDCTIKHYSVNDGLSQSSVYHFLEDRNGYMWIGTGNGLNRFDGYEFRIFKNDLQEPGTISHSIIRTLHQAPDGKIWIGTDAGINVFDSGKNNFFRPPSVLFSTNNVSCTILKTGADKVYFYATGIGIAEYSVSNKSTRIIDKDDAEIHRLNPYALTDHKFWFVNNNSLHSLDFITGEKEIFPLVKGVNITATILCVTDDERLIIHDEQGLSVFNTKTGIFEDISKNPVWSKFAHSNVGAISIDHHKRYWLSVNGAGLYVFDRNGQFIKSYLDEKNSDNTLSSKKHIVSLYCDRNDNTWAGTDDAGFFIVSLALQKFNLVNMHSGTGNIISSDFIKCFLKKGDLLWMGTFDKGINIINQKTGTITKYSCQVGDSTSLCNNTISSIFEDLQGNIWISTESGINLYNPVKNNFHRIGFQKGPIVDNYSPFVFQKNDGSLWARQGHGLYNLIRTPECWKLEKKFDTKAPSLMWQNKNGDCFLAYRSRGLELWRGNNTDTLLDIMHWPGFLKDLKFNCFWRDGTGNIWAATNAGLICMNQNYQFNRLYGIKEGLPDNFIYGILGDEQNRLWISTNKGLSCFNIRNKTFRNYTTADGLQSNEFNSGAFYKAADGEMFFGGINGFNRFYPERITDDPRPPLIKLISARMLDHEIDIQNAHPAIYHYDENSFAFEVSAIKFERPDGVTYAYWLEGAEKNWVFDGAKKNFRYNNLASGHYKLWARAANSDGIWSRPELLYSFTILAPWWETWWFKTLAVIGLGGITIGTTRYISRQKLKKMLERSEKEREIEKMRSRISRDLHDDIGSGLSRIALISENAVTEQDNPALKQQLEKLSHSSRELMESLGEIVWAMNPKHDDIESLMSYIRSYAYDYFNDTNIQCVIDFRYEGNETLTFNPETGRNIFLIVKEAMNNVLKYSNASVIVLALRFEQDYATLEICDNGCGLDISKDKNGNGLINMKRRCEEAGGAFTLESNPGQGVKIRLRFPFSIFSKK